MEKKISNAIVRFRIPLLILIALITIFFAYKIRHIKMAFGGGDIVPLSHPYVQLHQKMADTFGGSHLVAIALRVKDGDVLDAVTLAKVDRIQQKLESLRGIVTYKTISVASPKFSDVHYSIDEFGYPALTSEKYSDIVKKVLAGDRRVHEAFRKAVQNNSQVFGSIVSADKKGTAILTGFKWEEDYGYIFDNVQQILKAESDGNTEFFAAGRPIMLGYIDSYFRGILLVFGVAVAVMVGLLYLDFGTIRGVLLPLASGLLSVVWSVGFLAAVDIKIDVISITIPFLLVALAHGHSVQMLSRFNAEYAIHHDRRKAAAEAMSHLLAPMTTSIFADGVGLAALILLPFSSIRHMAIAGTIGVISVYIGCFVLIAAVLSLLPAPRSLAHASDHASGDRWVGPLFTRLATYSLGKGRWPIIAVSIIVVIIAGIGASKVKVGELQAGSPDFSANSPYNRAEHVLSGLTGSNLYWVQVNTGKDGGLFDPKVIRDISVLQQRLSELPEVGYSLSYVDALKKINSSLHEDDPHWEIIPTSAEMASQLFPMIGGARGVEETKDLYTRDCRAATISVFLKDRRPETIEKVFNASRDFVAHDQISQATFEFPGGLVGIYAAIIEEINRHEFTSVVIVVAVCLALTVLAFRSFLSAAIILVPLLIGKAIVLAVMGFGGIGLFVYTLPVITLGFGLGIDFSLYILARLQEEISSTGQFEKGYVRALGTSGRAVLFTGLTMAGGLVSLCFSEMRFQAILGLMLTVVVIANTFIALVFFPVFIERIRPRFLFKQHGAAKHDGLNAAGQTTKLEPVEVV